jgi:hypothetical protein
MSNEVDSWLLCLLNLLALCYLYILAVSRGIEKLMVVTIEVKKVVGKAVGQGLYWNKDLHKVEPSSPDSNLVMPLAPRALMCVKTMVVE